MIAWHRAILFHAELAELYEAQSNALFTSGRFSGFCDFCVRIIFLRENDKLICLIGKFALLLQRQTFKNLYVMKKNYLFPHQFRMIGWVLAIIAVVGYLCLPEFHFKMPSLYFDTFFDDENESGFFRMARTNTLSLAMPVLTIGLLFIGFSKEKVEDEFVQYLRTQSLIWATYVTAALFIIATLLIYGISYLYVPFLVFFVFLILFIVKFRIEVHRANKGGAQ
jgi:hypothetical protein